MSAAPFSWGGRLANSFGLICIVLSTMKAHCADIGATAWAIAGVAVMPMLVVGATA